MARLELGVDASHVAFLPFAAVEHSVRDDDDQAYYPQQRHDRAQRVSHPATGGTAW